MQKINITEADAFKMTSGRGVYAEVSGKNLYCGNEKYLSENSIEITDDVKAEAERLRVQGKALVLVAEEKNCIGILALSDVLRVEAKNMVDKLKAMNTEILLLTGDNKKTAHYFAEKVGITKVNAELLPEEKVECINKLQKTGINVCMIGDGK